MKSLIGVLSLVLVLGLSQADDPVVCDKTLGPEELHQVEGDWVLVWIVSDKEKLHQEMPDLTSSHVNIHLQDDNHTVVAFEQNLHGDGKCVSYNYNLTLPQNHEGHNRMDFLGATVTKDGEQKPYSEEGTGEFLPGSHNTMKILFKLSKLGDILLVYRREGQHVNDLEKDHEGYKALAKCLNLHGDKFDEWHYDGADFCHKKSVLPTLGSDELHQVNGEWVLLWMAHAKMSHDDLWVNLTSSHMEFHVQSDNHTVEMHERNMVGGKCISYKANLALPQKSEKIHRLYMDKALEITDGAEKTVTFNATAEFLYSSDDTLMMFYKSEKDGTFLLTYKKDGYHLDVNELEKDHERHGAMAKYLGLSGGNYDEWHFVITADFCHKKSAPES